MNTTLSDQIKAIQEARRILAASVANERELEEARILDAKLNDAGSSLAALNLNPDREKRIKNLEEMLRISNDFAKQIIPKMKDNQRGIIEEFTKRVDMELEANIKFDAAISGFASPDELTK